MRVLYFSDNTSDHNRRFLDKLSQAGLEIWFLDPTSEWLPENWLPDGVHWIRTRKILRRNATPSEFADFLPEFQDCVKDVRPDLIHAGPTHNCGYVAALSKFHPWLLTSWGSDVLYQVDQGPDWNQATQLALRSADGFFCDCDAVRTRAAQMAEMPDDRIVEFPWGIRQGSFAPQGPLPRNDKFVRETGTCVILSTRSWEPLYGIDVLLEAFRQASGGNPFLRLVLLGGGSGESWVQEFIRRHSLENKIRTPGNVARADMPNWFRAADVYVSCAQSDGTSVSLLEAMATGLPVVVTDIPSNREWVVEGANGWLAAVGSAREFSERYLLAANLGPEQRKVFSERNRRIVTERADWDQNFPKLLEMYERLVTMKPAKGESRRVLNR